MSGDGPFENGDAEQIEPGAAEYGEGEFQFAMTQRVGEYEFVSDGGDDDAADNEEVQVGVGETSHASGVFGVGHVLVADFGADIEIQPPEPNGCGLLGSYILDFWVCAAWAFAWPLPGSAEIFALSGIR